MLFFIFLSNFLTFVNRFDLCIVGGSSGLGRELIYQSLQNNNKVLALSNNLNEIKIPYRGGGLENKETDMIIQDKNLMVCNYNNFEKFQFENIVFTTGAKPFEKDYSDKITETILTNQNIALKKIVLISADGVGDSLPKSNSGIKIMNNWYLKDVYRAKNIQETLINKYKNDYNAKIFIIRPKVLSYGDNIFMAKSRKQLANEILSLF
jgi:hypothetical protein